MSEERDALADLRERADRLVAAPEQVGGRLIRLFGGLYRLFGWQAEFGTEALARVLEVLTSGVPSPELLQAAFDEAEHNVSLAERTVAVHRYVPTAHASWLARMLDTLSRVAALAQQDSPGARRALAGIDATRVLPPLRLRAPGRDKEQPPAAHERPAQARLLELQLSAIDHIMEAARGEARFIERRRRLLEGARRLLLDADAALPLDRAGVTARERQLALEITRLDRLQAAGIDDRVALPYQAKQALRRGDRDRLYTALLAMDSFALAVGDRATSEKTERALDEVLDGPGSFAGALLDDDLASRSVDRSAEELFGARVVDRIQEGYDAARRRYEADSEGADSELRQLALSYLAPGSEKVAMRAILAVDGCFEVGAALSPIRAREIEDVVRLVAHPTRDMLLVQARGVQDVPEAVLDDPRSVLMDLAAGRLLCRKFVSVEQRVVERQRLVGEVRVYLLDASTSMLEDGVENARARMRDAILLAELATMLRRLEQPGRAVRLSLYYRYFTKRLGELTRVRTAGEVLAAMADVVGVARKGGTDIQQALLSSFELIRDAKRDDPDLARANIVLVTDGVAPLDPLAIQGAREEAAGVRINVSVIALGEENPVLRDLVARQRARGERAFYHHVDDQRLLDLCRGTRSLAPVHAPAGPVEERGALRAGLEDVLRELDDLDVSRRLRPPGSATADEVAGLDGQRALEEAASRDGHALERRYARWFPEPGSAPTPGDEVQVIGSSAEAEAEAEAEASSDLDAIRIVLATIAEVVGELAGDSLHRRADAIELMERLLVDARFTPSRYHAFVQRSSHLLQDELAAVHAAVAGARASFAHRLEAATPGS